jgi:hypothetical protein
MKFQIQMQKNKLINNYKQRDKLRITLFERSILYHFMTKKILFFIIFSFVLIPNFSFAADPVPGDPPLAAPEANPAPNEDAPPADDPNNPDAALIERANADAEAAPAAIPKPKILPSVRLVNPIGGKYNEDYTKQTDADSQGNKDIQKIIGNAIQVTLRLLGAITLGVFFYGGFMWLTSAGNAEKVSTGTKTMMYATIGLFIIFGAYGILSTIISGITSGTPPVGGSSGSSSGAAANPNCDAQCQKEIDCSNKNNECLVEGRDYDVCLEELRLCTK